MKVGTLIKERRKELGLSLRQLSKRIDISISFLSDIENNRSNPSLDRLREIAEGLDCQVSYLLGENTFESKSEYKFIKDDENYEEIEKLLNNDDFIKILKEFRGFENWTQQEVDELISFLKAKRRHKEK